MSLNIPPAKGVTPANAAKELRQLLKNLYREGGSNGSPSPIKNLHDNVGNSLDAATYWLSEIETRVNALIEISRLRKPSLVKAEVQQMTQSGGFFEAARMALKGAKTNQHKFYGQASANLGGPAPNKTQLERAYALVQVLPTMENAPSGKTETTLRALTAIIKAHHGVLEGDVEQLPAAIAYVMGEILADGKPNTQQAEIWTPIHAPYGSVVSVADQLEAEAPSTDPQGPFLVESPPVMSFIIWGGKHAETKKNGFSGDNRFRADPVDAVAPEDWDWSVWNEGHCSWDAAVLIFKMWANRYDDPYTLRDEASGELLAQCDMKPGVAQKRPPIIWHKPIKEEAHAESEASPEGAGDVILDSGGKPFPVTASGHIIEFGSTNVTSG